MMRAPQTKRRWHVLMLGLVALLMALPGLSSIPVIDRDEARYAQASVQMVESGDYVEIRLGEEARNQKPVGAYWAQAASVIATGGLRDRPGQTLWAQRLPSVLALVVAAWLTYLAAIPMVGRNGAFIAGLLLCTSLIAVFEAHIAKTDALLLASTSAVFAALARLRAGRARGMAFLFWGGLGLSVLIKGPIGPAIAALALLGLFAWERRAGWARPLLHPLAVALGVLIVAPWLVAIGVATDGQFFADSLGRDFGGKLAGAAENHAGPPGYYALTLAVSLWPATLFLVPGLVFAWQAARRGGDALPARGMRLVLAWTVPFYLVLELAPTKLIHYPLPLFPALCTAMAGAVLAVAGGQVLRTARWVAVVQFLLGSAAVIGVVLYVQASLGDPRWSMAAYLVAALSGVAALAGCGLLIAGRARAAVGAALLAAVPLSVLVYGALVPRVEAARVSERLAAIAVPPIVSPDYQEASLRYYAGTRAVAFDTDWDDWDAWSAGTLVASDAPGRDTLPDVLARARADGVCLSEAGAVDGVNYSRGEAVSFVLLRQVACGVSGP